MINIVFFASYREQTGLQSLQLALPVSPARVSDLIAELQRRFGEKGGCLNDRKLLVSVNRQMAKLDSLVKKGDEVAFFPPVTGG